MIGVSLLGGLASMAMMAAVTTSVSTVSDPVNSSLTPKDIPGARMQYSVTVSNNSINRLDSGTVMLKDAIPLKTKLYVGTVGTAGPVAFAQGLPASGLTYSFISLSNTVDDLDFSSDGGSTWGYAPVADADGCDAKVTNIRIKPEGPMAAGGIFSVRFQVVVQ